MNRFILLVLAFALTSFATGLQAKTCKELTKQWLPLFRGPEQSLWMLEAPAEETSAQNRGLNSNIVLALTPKDAWLVGSGGLPSTGTAITCSIENRFQRKVTDLIQVRPHPEAVMGASGVVKVARKARVWALPEVREAMNQQCAVCIERFNARIKDVKESLKRHDVVLANNEVNPQIPLGPFKVFALERQKGSMTLALLHETSNTWVLGGMLWASDVPDARETHPSAMIKSLTQVIKTANEAARIIPEQGALSNPAELKKQFRYWQWLEESIKKSIEQGSNMPTNASDLPYPEFIDYKHYKLRHALNLQRVWRLLE